MHLPRYRLLGAAFVVGSVALLVPLKFQGNSAFWEKSLDAVHIPFFAGVTWLLTVANPLGIVGHRPRAVTAIGLAILAAVAIEIIQPLVGREESLIDLRNGFFGVALAGAALWHPAGYRGCLARFVWATVATAVLLIALQPCWVEARGILWRSRNFPVLADFESDDESCLWLIAGLDPNDWEMQMMARSPDWPAHGASSLKVNLGPASYPGIRLLTGNQDWRGYTAFQFDLFNPGTPFDLALRIDDDSAEGNQDTRFNRSLPVHRGWNHFRIPLAEIEKAGKLRPLRIAAIRRIIFFRDHPRDYRSFYLDYLRLERETGPS